MYVAVEYPPYGEQTTSISGGNTNTHTPHPQTHTNFSVCGHIYISINV